MRCNRATELLLAVLLPALCLWWVVRQAAATKSRPASAQLTRQAGLSSGMEAVVSSAAGKGATVSPTRPSRLAG